MDKQRKLSDLINYIDIDASGNLVISVNAAIGGTDTSTYKLAVTGNMRVDGGFTWTSRNALHKVRSLRGVNYNRTDDEDARLKMGFIAQEVDEVIPEVVDKSTELYGIEYANIVALLVEAIKEQDMNYSNAIKMLIESIEFQQKEINELKKRL
jgi:hypothetical protein